ncbi:polysaccharide deacetylase family protein [Carboxylicivirga mesophila]|uniref:Polysaccharide deacetylase family protein n=1 Tax=Carboxylicivirga mesophila TaxID=1166478 RepID=A0ABS5K7T6_9BACT|nr:polysaccharide deacetylase family protein [Carboxylicivirga mesophila]MBS2211049.1 polysaccharide deacetylase family protein [Carboxylicivirga mesophila]
MVAISIDDVPNISLYAQDGYKTLLLDSLEELAIPVAIFINEGLFFDFDDKKVSEQLLERWIESELLTVGTHTFAHTDYSKVGLEVFRDDVIKGMLHSQRLCADAGKTIKYFRFPYNSLGNDSIEQSAIGEVLDSLHLTTTPFTIESSDWMFNAIYEYYIKTDSTEMAAAIGDAYVNATIKNFMWMDSLSIGQYHRHIKQIYLCHDNTINADYLPRIINMLRNQGYLFVSLGDALNDSVYQQQNYYHKKWGISWVYRWMNNEAERKRLMKMAPDGMEYYPVYERLNNTTGY